MSKFKGGELEKALCALLQDEKELVSDGKSLRGSKRVGGEAALKELSIAWATLKQVWAQRQVEGDELETAIAVLEELPLEGKMISADAGILKAPFVQKVVEKKGGISA